MHRRVAVEGNGWHLFRRRRVVERGSSAPAPMGFDTPACGGGQSTGPGPLCEGGATSGEGAVGAEASSACRVSAGGGSGAAVLRLHGNLDVKTAADVRRELAGAARERVIVLDLTRVDFIDAVGLGVLIKAIRDVHEHGGLVAVATADARRGIGPALRGAGLDRVVVLADSPARAHAALRATCEEMVR